MIIESVKKIVEAGNIDDIKKKISDFYEKLKDAVYDFLTDEEEDENE